MNYLRMSEELGLHHKNFNVMRATHSKINKLRSESKEPLVKNLINA